MPACLFDRLNVREDIHGGYYPAVLKIPLFGRQEFRLNRVINRAARKIGHQNQPVNIDSNEARGSNPLGGIFFAKDAGFVLTTIRRSAFLTLSASSNSISPAQGSAQQTPLEW